MHQLLQKLQPDMIVLDPSTIGQARALLAWTAAPSLHEVFRSDLRTLFRRSWFMLQQVPSP